MMNLDNRRKLMTTHNVLHPIDNLGRLLSIQKKKKKKKEEDLLALVIV